MIILVNSNFSPCKITGFLKNKTYKYMYLSKDISRKTLWQNYLCSLTEIEVGSSVNVTANDIRSNFINFIRELNKRNVPNYWWLSRISEQNTMVSDLFLNCCKLELISNIIKHNESDLVFILDDWFLLRNISSFLSANNIKHIFLGKNYLIPETIKYYFRFIYLIIAFLLKSFHAFYISHRARNIKHSTADKEKNILLHTWIDESCLGNNDIFKDRYFNILPYWLKEKGFKISILPVLYNIERPLKEAISWLRKNKINFIIPSDFLKISDYFSACLISIKLLFIPPDRNIFFLNKNIYYLIKNERLLHAASTLYFSLYLKLPARLKAKGYNFDIIIDVFEGMVAEKALLLGTKSAYPKSKTIGYQHSSIPNNLLCYFINNEYVANELLPDKIICNGPISKKILSSIGLSEKRLIGGCALRYTYGDIQRKKDKTILVSLPLQEDHISNIILKLSDIVSELRDVFFIIKPHPMSDLFFINKVINLCKWKGDNFKIVDGSFNSWLNESSLLITSASTTALEALLAGIPLIILGCETLLDLNPLEWFDTSFSKIFYRTTEISNRIIELLNISEKEIIKLEQLREFLNKECFTPVEDELMEVFLNIA